MFAVIASAAFAGDVEIWRRDTFGTADPLAGTDGWDNGYVLDGWFADGDAFTASDHETLIGGAFGDGSPMDNWLIRGPAVAEGSVTVAFDTEDNDTMGLVFAHDRGDSFYLVGFTERSAPPPISLVSNPTVFVLKVRGGSVELSASVAIDARPATLGFARDDASLQAFADGVQVLDAVDGSPLGAGVAGLYAYGSGNEGLLTGNTDAWFESIVVFAHDGDDDGYIDDVDNCDEVGNDQTDVDGDGIGDACQDPSPPDTGPPPTEPPDTAILEPPGRTTASLPDPLAGVGCGCGSGTGAGWLLVAFGALGMRRTRA